MKDRQKLTLFMTDIEGSTALWEAEPEATSKAIARHDEIIDELVSANDGKVLKNRGEGDAAFCVFQSEERAVAAAIALQNALAVELWPTTKAIKVRIAVHSGEVEGRDGDYYGSVVNRCARLRGIGHGGQIVVSQAVYKATGEEYDFRDHGLHRLKDLLQHERIYEVVYKDEHFPALRSLNLLDNNLPIQLTEFVGRESDLVAVQEALSTSRLVTLTGVGGAGKTRLSLQVSALYISGTEQSVRFVTFADLPRNADVSATVALGLGLELRGQISPADTVIESFAEREALFIFDNCEHVLDSVAKITTHILRDCPNVRILATSREDIGLKGEKTYETLPLSLPREGETHPLKVMKSEAVSLFLTRVRQRRTGFVLDAGSAPLVAKLVRALDGVPLAIEHAAARVGSLGLDSIIERLEHKLDVLKSTHRDIDPRQRTVRATIEWSFDLLDEEEQETFVRVSSFQGIFSTDDASAICGWDTLGLIESLVQKSVVSAVHTSSHEMGYRLLDTVKEYCRERINEVAPDAYKRHFKWALDTAILIDETIESSQEAFAILDRSYEDMTAALDRAIGANDENALRLAFALRKPWIRRGPTVDGIELLGRAITEIGSTDESLLADAHNALGAMALQVGQKARAIEHLDIAAARFGDLNLPIKVAAARANMGIVYAYDGDFVAAKPLFEESFAAYKTAGDDVGAAKVALNFGRMLADSGHKEDARLFLNAALDIFAGKDRLRECLTLINLTIALPKAETQKKLDCLKRALLILSDLPDSSQLATALLQLAQIAVECRHFSESAVLLALVAASYAERGTTMAEGIKKNYDELIRIVEYELPNDIVVQEYSKAKPLNEPERVSFATELTSKLSAYLSNQS